LRGEVSALEKQISGLLADGVTKLHHRLSEVVTLTATVLLWTLTCRVSCKNMLCWVH